MEKTEVLEILKRLGWEPAPPGYPTLAHKRFGEEEALAWWYRDNWLKFEFYSCGRNIAAATGGIVQSKEDVIKAVQQAEEEINQSFYMRFIARKEQACC
jgi:hypothetical protein